VDAGVPIIPIILHGTRSIMPKGQLRVYPGNVLIDIKKPVETSGYTRNNKDDLLERIRNIICDVFDEPKEANQDA
jgi:1-acyl-sn-glycerol-3-phosphate acyltransferase